MLSTPRRRAAAWAVVGVLAAALSLLAIVAILETRQGTATNTRILRIVEDCTTPGRVCADRGAKATADAIADINRVTVYAAACADRPRTQTEADILACVLARLAADTDHD